MTRSASRSRTTKETDISITVEVDGDGTNDITTGLPFFDHMLDQLGRHGGMNLTVHATGDLHVDGHHTVEDVGILLGETFREALGDKAGVRRFASGLFPLDEALIEVALDLSGRPYLVHDEPEIVELIGFSERQLERADCGVSGFIPKPYDLREVVEFVRSKVSGPPSSRRLWSAEPGSGVSPRPASNNPPRLRTVPESLAAGDDNDR